MRPRKCRLIRSSPVSRFYKPRGIPTRDLQIVSLKDEEWEAILLADHRGLEQEEAAKLMGVSRPTFSRVLASARKAVARALAEGCALRIGGGDFRTVPGGSAEGVEEREMKIAFAISGVDLSSPIDDSFGRAPRFLIYDVGTREFEVIPNAALNDGHGAGFKAAETVIKAGATAVVAGECGPKAADVLTKAGVRIHLAKSMDVRQTLALHFHEVA